MKINPITAENVKNQDFFTEMEWVSVTWMGETSQFFTKRGAQMHYIRKSYPRAFQNIQKYSNRPNNGGEISKLHSEEFLFNRN